MVGFLLKRAVRLINIDPPYGEDYFLGRDVEGGPALFSRGEHTVVGFDQSHGAILESPHG